jgi:hypothetical protein
LIVLFEPGIEVILQLLQRRVELFAKGHAIEFILHCAVEPFTDAVGLRRLSSRSAVINVFHRQIELIFVMLTLAAVLGSAIGQNAQQRNLLLFKEGQDAIIQQIGRNQRIFAIV